MLNHEELVKLLAYFCINNLGYDNEARIEYCRLNELMMFQFTIGADNNLSFPLRNCFSLFLAKNYIILEKWIEHKIQEDKTILICVMYKGNTIENLDQMLESILNETKDGAKFIEILITSNKDKIENGKDQIKKAILEKKLKPMEDDIVGIVDIHYKNNKQELFYSHLDQDGYTKMVNF